MSPRQCLRTYNRLTARFCDGVRVFPRKATKSSMEQCEAYLGWCKMAGIDPERFIRARHDATGWRFRIPLARLHQVGEGFVDKFKDWGDGKQAESQINERMTAIVADDTDRTKDLTTLSERAKAEFFQTPEVCIMSLDLTLGHHPRSEWCRQCRLATACKSQLPASVRKARGGQ